MKKLLTVGIVFILAGILAGCNMEQGTQKTEETQERASNKEQTQKSEKPKTQKPKIETLQIGQEASFDNGGSVTVHSYEQPVFSPNQFAKPKAGNDYAMLDVEGCAGDMQATLNPFDFQGQMSDNTRLRATLITGLEPQLHHTDLLPGDCVRGNVGLEVPQGQSPQAIIYTQGQQTARWTN
jgi:hypothetical protein